MAKTTFSQAQPKPLPTKPDLSNLTYLDQARKLDEYYKVLAGRLGWCVELIDWNNLPFEELMRKRTSVRAKIERAEAAISANSKA